MVSSAGSKAKFWGVSWYGWRSQLWVPIAGDYSPNYWINVRQAFKTAPAFKQLVDDISGDVTVIAHSLGNMVVASAIADHRANVAKFFMVNAAVPAEALYGEEKVADQMLGDYWSEYKPVLYSSMWHTLFDDSRSQLTWRNRLISDRAANYYNFFSSGEDVLSASWRTQERLKGVFNLYGLDYGGWGFNLDDYVPNAPSCSGCNDGELRWPADRANAIADAELRTKPFFRKGGPIDELAVPGIVNSALVDKYRNRVLAEAFPALTSAVGLQLSKGILQINNTDMDNALKNNKNGKVYWPREKQNWRHSDLKEVAYSYVFPLFNQFVKLGDKSK